MDSRCHDYHDGRDSHDLQVDAAATQKTGLLPNNEAILDMVPVCIKHEEKWYSASDGGFLSYRGRFFKKGGQTFVDLTSSGIPTRRDQLHPGELELQPMPRHGE